MITMFAFGHRKIRTAHPMSRTTTLLASAAMLASTLTLAAGTTNGASAAKGWDRQAPADKAETSSTGARRLKCRARISDRTPEQYSNVFVKVRTAKRARVHTVAKYKTTKTHKFRRANRKGRAR